jgi:hypothetical protein
VLTYSNCSEQTTTNDLRYLEELESAILINFTDFPRYHLDIDLVPFVISVYPKYLKEIKQLLQSTDQRNNNSNHLIPKSARSVKVLEAFEQTCYGFPQAVVPS